MSELNKVLIIGNITKNVEIRFTPKGNKVINLRLALHRKFMTKENEKREETTFVSVIYFDKLAELCEKYLSKGDKILVEGRLHNREWINDKGDKVNLIEIYGERLQFIYLKNENKNISENKPNVDSSESELKDLMHPEMEE